MTSTENQSAKQDADKAPAWRGLLAQFPHALSLVASVSDIGHEKYGRWDGWLSVDQDRYRDALIRHLLAESMDPGGVDAESGLPHAAHTAWNALAVLQLGV